jgi:hypothetical protein
MASHEVRREIIWALPHYVENTPHELVRAHLKIDESILAKFPPRKMPVVGA